MKEIAHFPIWPKFGKKGNKRRNIQLEALPKALRHSGTPVPFTALALETKVSLTMCSEEGGFYDEPLSNEYMPCFHRVRSLAIPLFVCVSPNVATFTLVNHPS